MIYVRHVRFGVIPAVLLFSAAMLTTYATSHSAVFAQNSTAAAQNSTEILYSLAPQNSVPITPTPDIDSDDDSSSSNDNDDDDNNSDGTSSSEDEDDTEDDLEQTNPLLEQIRNRVNGELAAFGIPVP